MQRKGHEGIEYSTGLRSCMHSVTQGWILHPVSFGLNKDPEPLLIEASEKAVV